MENKKKTKSQLIQILQDHHHPNSLGLANCSKQVLLEMIDESSLKKIEPPITSMDNIEDENKKEILRKIRQILLPNPTLT